MVHDVPPGADNVGIHPDWHPGRRGEGDRSPRGDEAQAAPEEVHARSRLSHRGRCLVLHHNHGAREVPEQGLAIILKPRSHQGAAEAEGASSTWEGLP